jgi:serine O-acetyltransferase
MICYCCSMTNVASRLVYLQKKPIVGSIARMAGLLFGFQISPDIEIGRGLNIAHRGCGTVLNTATRIGNFVTIYHNVTLARSDSWVPLAGRAFPGFEIQDHVVLCPGSVLLAGKDQLTVGEGTVVGANSVLTKSTGAWEIWAGSPAVRVGKRTDRPRHYRES